MMNIRIFIAILTAIMLAAITGITTTTEPVEAAVPATVDLVSNVSRTTTNNNIDVDSFATSFTTGSNEHDENSAGLLLTGASTFHLTPARPWDRVTVRRRADARVDLATGAGREASAR